MREAVLYKKTGNKMVRCTACSHYCTIPNGNVGICATRINRDGKLFSMVYGQIIGPNLDPVEKKPLYHFFPGKSIFSFGTLGCNFGCQFCQNAWMSQVNKIQNKYNGDKLEEKINLIIEQYSKNATPAQIVRSALATGAIGIAYTYNEPAIFAEMTHDTAKLAKARGLVNVYVSNGFESKELNVYMRGLLDAINIDLKSNRDSFYKEICNGSLKEVKRNIEWYFKSGVTTEVTTLIIPGKNDSEEELKGIASYLASISPDIPWHISAFSPSYKMTDIPPTGDTTLEKGLEIGKESGLNYVYSGNSARLSQSATDCPGCGSRLATRDNYQTVITDIMDLKQGKCRHCGTKIYGRWG